MNNDDVKLDAQAGAAAANDVPLPKWIVPAGFIVGCVFLGAILVIALLVPNPTSSQQTIFHSVVALAGAGYSMSLTGLLSVRLNLPSKGAIVAGGTLAVFTVLFFFSPDIGKTQIVGDHNNVIQGTSGDVSVTKTTKPQ